MPTYKVNDSDSYGRNASFNNKGYLTEDGKKYEDNLPSYSGIIKQSYLVVDPHHCRMQLSEQEGGRRWSQSQQECLTSECEQLIR